MQQNNRYNRQRPSLRRENAYQDPQANTLPQLDSEFNPYNDPFAVPPPLAYHNAAAAASMPSPPPTYQNYTSAPPMYFLAHPEIMVPYAPNYGQPLHPLHPHHASHPMPPPHLRYPTTNYPEPVPAATNFHTYRAPRPSFQHQHPHSYQQNFFYDHPTGRFFYKPEPQLVENPHYPLQASSAIPGKPQSNGKSKADASSSSNGSVIITEVDSDDDELSKSMEDRKVLADALRKASIKKDYVDAVSVNEAVTGETSNASGGLEEEPVSSKDKKTVAIQKI